MEYIHAVLSRSERRTYPLCVLRLAGLSRPDLVPCEYRWTVIGPVIHSESPLNKPALICATINLRFVTLDSGMSTGIYTTNSPDACHYVASHARCNVIVVEDDKQLQKILSIRDRLPHLKAIVQYRGQPDKRLQGVYSVKPTHSTLSQNWLV
jgi:hypothetical protein